MTYIVSKEELIGKLTECLDSIEGDFSNDDIHQALTFMNGYAPTSNSNKAREKEWARKIKKMEIVALG